MSQAYKCDRCGKLYESEMRTLASKNYSVLKPHTINYELSNPSTYLCHVADLCPECQEQLEMWIKGGIPLPKGRGRSMILSEDELKENQIDLDFSCQKWIEEICKQIKEQREQGGAGCSSKLNTSK